LLNNEMDDFSLRPEIPNGYRLRSGEATASSAQAAAVEHDADVRRGRASVLVLGAPEARAS